MQTPIIKNNFLSNSLFFFILCFSFFINKAKAQINYLPENVYFDEAIPHNDKPVPKGTKLVDMWGYPWVNTGGSSELSSALVYQCSVFRLTFGDVDHATGKGYDDPTFVSLASGHPLGSSTTLGALRRWTACQVFDYISQTISVPSGASSPDIYFDISELDGTGALAFATPFFSTSANPTSFNGGLLNQHIVTGVDPTPNPGDYDAKITCDFGPNNGWPTNGGTLPINSDAYLTNAGGLDLFSILLHEATHALGFFSNMQSNGLSAVTNTSPGLYSLFDRYVLNASNANLINNSTFSFQGGVAQLTSNTLKYFKSTNSKSYAVYSPIAWKAGSSLSHFDEMRDNNENYVMTASYSGGLKRSYMKGEMEVLCDLGYTLTVTGFSCADRYAIGVDDNASTTISAPVTKDVIVNDYDLDGQSIALDASSVTLLTNAGTVSSSGNNITFTPNGTYAGDVIIKYRPYTVVNGYTGSSATLTINIQSPGYCPLDPCNFICNGGFEDGLTIAQFDAIANSGGVFHTVQFGGIPGWHDLTSSADSYFRGSQAPGPGNTPAVNLPISFIASQSPGVETPTSPNNNRYAGLYQAVANGAGQCQTGIEGLYRQLVQPLVPGTSYTLSYSARAICPCFTFSTCTTAFLATSFSNSVPTIPANACQVYTGDYFNSAFIQTVNSSSSTNTWTNVSYTFTATQSSNYIVIQPNIGSGTNNCNSTYIFMDNFRLEKAGNQVSTLVTSSLANPKVGQNVTFTVKVCNTSTSTLNNVGVVNILPAGFSLVSSTFSAYPNHTIGTLAGGACVTLTVTAQAQSSVAFNTDLQDCASITTANACAQTQSCATVKVLATDISVAAATQSCTAFRVTISNIGTVDAHNVAVNYTPPGCFGYSGYSIISGTATYASNQINIPVIPFGTSVVIEFTGSGITPGCVNTATLTGAYDEWDLNLTNNSGSVTMPGPGCVALPCINLPRAQ